MDEALTSEIDLANTQNDDNDSDQDSQDQLLDHNTNDTVVINEDLTHVTTDTNATTVVNDNAKGKTNSWSQSQ